MKRFCILLCILLLPSCRSAELSVPADSITATTAAESKKLPEEPGAAVYPLSEIPAEAVTLDACIEKPIPPKSILQVLCSTEQDGISAAVFVTADTEFYAAVQEGEQYTAFHFIGDSSYPYPSTVTLEPFSGVLGESGIRLSYSVGANAANVLFFTFPDGQPTLLAQCNKGAIPHGNLLIEQYGGMGMQIHLYRRTEEGLVRLNLNEYLQRVFPDVHQIYPVFHKDLFCGEHPGLLEIQLMNTDWSYRTVSGYFTDDALVLLPLLTTVSDP
ncbi:MAG: hypothetical protein IJD06_03895 [Clostridia bacterium]|nr:hypothetical protein [Clostridia bacterium]